MDIWKGASREGFLLGAIALGLVAVFACGTAAAQNTPLISGAAGLLTNRNQGQSAFQPVIAPLIAAPLGKRVLIESRADIRDYRYESNGGYPGDFEAGLQYAQTNISINNYLTLVAGKFLLPFNTYNERLSTIWVPLLQDAPIAYAIGTRTSGAGMGGELRGVMFSSAHAQFNYNAYVSAKSSTKQFESARTAGGQAAVYFPAKRLEIGFSYQRFLQQTHLNNWGTHVWWLPPNSAYQLRSEYSHGAASQGYWIEQTYRMSRFGGESSLIGRFQPVFRLQQTFRNRKNFAGESDAMPSADVKQLDFGFNYNLPHEVRLNSSYSRSFTTKNHNLWDLSLTYRFLFPTWKGR